MKFTTKYEIGQEVWQIINDEAVPFKIGEIEIHIGSGGSSMVYYFPYIQAPKNQDDKVWSNKLFETERECKDQIIEDIKRISESKISTLSR